MGDPRPADPEEQVAFLMSGMLGLVTYIAVRGIGALLDADSEKSDGAVRSGAAAFLYLGVLDLRFDGVMAASRSPTIYS